MMLIIITYSFFLVLCILNFKVSSAAILYTDLLSVRCPIHRIPVPRPIFFLFNVCPYSSLVVLIIENYNNFEVYCPLLPIFSVGVNNPPHRSFGILIKTSLFEISIHPRCVLFPFI